MLFKVKLSKGRLDGIKILEGEGPQESGVKLHPIICKGRSMTWTQLLFGFLIIPDIHPF